jgi:hypothetical protein
MVRRTLLNAAVIAATLVPLGLLSCSDDNPPAGAGGSGGSGGSGGTGGTAGTAGAPTDGGTSDAQSDAPTADSGRSDGRSDAPPTLPDGSVPPSGTQLVSGEIALVGVTTDNYAVYANETAGTLNTVSLAGGTPAALGSMDDRVVVRGAAVVTWVGSARVSPLSVWTAANGTKPLSMSSAASAAAVAVSPDGTRILYFDGVDAGRTRGNLFIAGTDGSNPKQLAESVVLNNVACAPVLAFGGNAAAAAAFCLAPAISDGGATDGGTADATTPDDGATDGATTDGASPDAGPVPPAIVQSYSGASWTATTIATNVEPRVAISPNGTTVLVSAPAGLLAYPIAGGMATTLDPAGGTGMFTNDGLSVIYTTPANALKRTTVASPSPTTLAATGFAGIRAKSPDENWLLGYTTIDTSQDLSDLYLASATMPATPVTLSAEATAGLFRSDGFTADSRHAIYYTGIADGVGTFFSVPTSGGAAVALGTNVWLHYAGTGSKVTFNDNYNEAMSTADIRVADTAQPGPATLLVSLADPDYFIAGSKDRVVYTWKYLPGSMSGLWIAPIP